MKVLLPCLFLGLVCIAQPTDVTTIKVPDNYDLWVITPKCEDALHLYEHRGETSLNVDIWTPKSSVSYKDGETVELIERVAGCAKVRLANNGQTGFLPAELATPSKDERKKQSAQRVAITKAEADKAKALARFPVLDSGLRSVFIASDRKCSEQFVQALSMDGLEKRASSEKSVGH